MTFFNEAESLILSKVLVVFSNFNKRLSGLTMEYSWQKLNIKHGSLF